MQIQRAYRKDEQRTNKERTMSGSTVALQRTKDEQKTNKRRTKDEEKVKVS